MNHVSDYFVIDGHCDVLYQLEQDEGQRSLRERPEGQVDLKRLQEGQVAAQFFALYGGEPNRVNVGTVQCPKTDKAVVS